MSLNLYLDISIILRNACKMTITFVFLMVTLFLFSFFDGTTRDENCDLQSLQRMSFCRLKKVVQLVSVSRQHELKLEHFLHVRFTNILVILFCSIFSFVKLSSAVYYKT